MRSRLRTPGHEERMIDIIRMRLEGCTFQEIADKYGVTRQFIQQELSAVLSPCTRAKWNDERVAYPNLAEWIGKNNITRFEFTEIIGLKRTSSECAMKKLYGETDFTISEIKKLLELTGKTFEYLFAEKA